MNNIIFWIGITLAFVLVADILYLWLKNKDEEKKAGAQTKKDKY